MSDPHFHEEEVVETVSTTRARPVRTERVVVERRGGIGAFNTGNTLAYILAAGLIIFILVLVLAFIQ